MLYNISQFKFEMKIQFQWRWFCSL